MLKVVCATILGPRFWRFAVLIALAVIRILSLTLLLLIVALLAFQDVQDVLLEMLQEGSIGVAASVCRFCLVLALVIDLRRLLTLTTLK